MTSYEEKISEQIYDARKRIIPIIGDEAFVCQWQDYNGEKKEGSLQEYVYSKLHKKVKKIGNYYNRRGMDRKDFDYEITHGISKNEISLRSEIKKFLEAGNFEVIISTDCFGILKKELGNNYFLTSFQPPAKYEKSKGEESDFLQRPSIYQIFGNHEGQWVFNEQDFLRFLHHLHLSGAETGKGPSSLIKYLKENCEEKKLNHLLIPLGCDYLPDWIFRFLWYPISPSVATLGGQQHLDGGIWLSETSNDAFKNFLKDESFYYWDIKHSVTEILNRVTKKIEDSLINDINKLGVVFNKEKEWDIFLSYAKEKGETPPEVKKLYDCLTNKLGKRVWLDNRDIKAGENYWHAIKYGILYSNCFMYAITTTYLDKLKEPSRRNKDTYMERTGVSQEVNYIIDNYKKNPEKINIPVVIKGAAKIGDEILDESNMGILESLHSMKGYEEVEKDTELLFKEKQICIFDKDNTADFLSKIPF